MKKQLLISAAAATLLYSPLSAESMYERFEALEAELKTLKAQMADMKGSPSVSTADEAESDTDEAEESEGGAFAALAAEEGEDEGESGGGLFADLAAEDEGDPNAARFDDLQEQISNLNAQVNGNAIKWDVDFRTTYDNIQYDMADGSEAKNDGLLTNRLWLGMSWKYDEMLSFTGQLAYHSTYGQRWSAANPTDEMTNYQMAGFDWVSSEKAYDDELRVRKAYWFLRDETLLGADIPWTFSLGRRPSTNGKLIALRDDDHESSPIGHAINVEFDGLSAKLGLHKLTGVNGMYVKLCAGRGGTYASSWSSATPYASTQQDIDLAGAILSLYNDGQYSLTTQFYMAKNLIDANDPTNLGAGFKTVGDLESYTASLKIWGIGDGWSDFLDDTVFFLSGSMSKTNPDDEGLAFTGMNGMLGSTESQDGYSYWVGLQTPGFTDSGRFGLEFNHGSQYWRPVTYSEDTMIGSKIATRGDAYEAYYTQNLIGKAFTMQLRYTYIDYKYGGSNGFFGSTTGGAYEISETMPFASNYVDKAQDIRFYIRYRN